MWGRSLRKLMKLSFSKCHFKWWIGLSFKVNRRRIGKLVERDEKINQSSYLNNAGASILHPPACLQLGKCNQFSSKALPLPVVELESMINLNFQQFKYWFKLCQPPSCKLFPVPDWIYILPSFSELETFQPTPRKIHEIQLSSIWFCPVKTKRKINANVFCEWKILRKWQILNSFNFPFTFLLLSGRNCLKTKV